MPTFGSLRSRQRGGEGASGQPREAGNGTERGGREARDSRDERIQDAWGSRLSGRWLALAWDQQQTGLDPAFPGPLIGPYDSGNRDVLEYHLLLMKLAGIVIESAWSGCERTLAELFAV